MVTELKYLRRVLTKLNDDWPVVVANLRKPWKRWERLSRILVQEGDDPQTSMNPYKQMVETTLLFGAETWIIFPRIGSILGGFHHRVTCELTGMRPRRDTTGR